MTQRQLILEDSIPSNPLKEEEDKTQNQKQIQLVPDSVKFAKIWEKRKESSNLTGSLSATCSVLLPNRRVLRLLLDHFWLKKRTTAPIQKTNLTHLISDNKNLPEQIK